MTWKRQLQEMKGDQTKAQIDSQRREGGDSGAGEYGQADVKRLDNEGDTYVQSRGTATLSVEEARSINRMPVAEVSGGARACRGQFE